MFRRILIANRGEIACRVIRTCRRLGIETVAVHSDADATAQHVRQADLAYPIGGPLPSESYLRGDVVLDVARRCGAEAIHPGYGFLSENADFAAAAEGAGIVFIGPRAESMRRMGSKAGAKDLMSAHGVPVVPGYTGDDQGAELLAREAEHIGYPLMIKAAYGGGGKGMRIVRHAGEFAANLDSCRREAKNAFGRERVLLERYIEQPRHIEFQIFGDARGHVVHLNERECSAQRRYQKVLEETPSPFMTPRLRERMGAAAIAAGRALDYVNAGTVEFIVGAQAAASGADFYFMEINTRLQVEHPVTEMVSGFDLVEWQLRVAAGEALPQAMTASTPAAADGHAIELRLYAEDPEQGFLPGSGTLERLRLPAPSAHIRVDAGVVEGDTVSIFYDPMIAKLIAWDQTREAALLRMREALAACDVVGPKSNIAFLERLIRHPVVVDGHIDTGYLDRHLAEFIGASAYDDSLLVAAAIALLLHHEHATAVAATRTCDPHSPWACADGWRAGHRGTRALAFVDRGERIEVAACGSTGAYRLRIGGAEHEITHASIAGVELSAAIDGVSRRWRATIDGGRISVHDGHRRRTLTVAPTFAYTAAIAASGDRVVAPMPGRIVLIKAAPGDAVVHDQEVLVMEAMKMELTLRAPRDGIVERIQAAVGDFVEAEATLLRLVAEPAA